GIRDGHVTGVQTCALPILIGPRDRLEARNRDPITADLAVAVRPVVHPRESLRDLFDGLTRRGRQGEVSLALDAEGVAFARFLVEIGRASCREMVAILMGDG